MTLKRILTIIIVLLILAGMLFGVSWYVARKNAEKSGTEPLSFREFLGIGTPNAPGQNGGGELTGEFTGQPSYTLKYDENNNGINDWLEDLNNNGLVDGNEDQNNNGMLDGMEDADNDGTNNNQDTYIDPRADDTNLTPTLPDDTGTTPDTTPNDPGGFTNEPITPEGGNPNDDGGFDNGGNPGGGDNPGGGSNPGGGTGTGPNDPGYGDEEDIPEDPEEEDDDDLREQQLACLAEDVNIEFTAGELRELEALQNRFNAIKDTLYDDAAASQQFSLYTSFKLKKDQTADLVRFCENATPGISDPKMRRRVPTPFYRGAGDTNTFTNNATYTSEDSSRMPSSRKPLLNYPVNASTLFERLLRINIW